MIPVNSSSLEAYEYDPETRVLSIKFRSSKPIYDYFDVPQSVIDDFEQAASKGKFFYAAIKSQYQTVKREGDAITGQA